jgi:hypothetical protein
MSDGNAFRRILGSLGLVLFASAAVGCVPRTDDINRVQPGYVDKAFYQSGHEWHYRRSIVDSETANQVAIEGAGDLWVDRVVWEIQEDLLIARKPYSAIPGSGLDSIPGGEDDFEGPVIGMWPIESHFDIIRDYDTLTRRERNTIVENSVDRPWNERRYMRVNWANNLVQYGSPTSFYGAYSVGWVPLQFISTGSQWTHIETRGSEGDLTSARISDDYMEYSERVFLSQDTFTCWAFAGFSLAVRFGGCGFGEATVRHSFVRIDEDSGHTPRFYPDTYVRKDENGEITPDDETGEVEREDVYGRFGVFRLDTPTYDRGYGITQSGRLYRAMLFNIWEESVDENGDEIPYELRQEKPIIYYLNAEYPARYRETAAEVGAEYNRVFKNMVADLKGVSTDEVMDMFEVRTNDCNETNIVNYVLERPELAYAVGRITCGENDVCGLPTVEGQSMSDMDALQLELEQEIGLGNLRKVCTSLEAATYDRPTGKSDFNWQRVGDLRYNFIVWLNNPQRSGWGGYGPMHADALSGETIAATAYIRGVYYEIGAANVADYICFMNDEEDCSMTNIAYGQNIRAELADTRDRYLEISQTRASDAMMSELRNRMDALTSRADGGLPVDKSGRSIENRLSRLAGTEMEKRLMDPGMMALLSDGQWLTKELDGEVPSYVTENATLENFWRFFSPLAPERDEARRMMEAGGFCFLTQDLDPHYAGLALDLKDLSREERIEVISNRMIKHVILHEVGHNVGLAHNFEGSYDALNYNPRFWEILGTGPENEVENNLDEYRHTTVMEYMSSKGMFADALGTYDQAAIRFAYGNQVQVFASDAYDPSVGGGESMKDWRYYNDYRKIPDYLCGGDCGDRATAVDVVSNREWVQFDPQNPPANEVPYLFCDNFYNFRTPFCRVFDYGSSISETQANNYRMWKNYYVFNSFARDRLSPYGWSIGRALQPVFMVLDMMDTASQYFQILSATDPNFEGTDLEADLASVLFQSMNIAAEIMAIPSPDRFCPLQFQGQSVPTYFTAFTAAANGVPCDRNRPINSPIEQASNAIDINLGNGRPLGIGLSEDLEERQISYIGSFFDKRMVGLFLGATTPRLFRFNYQLDLRNIFLSPYRLFEPEMRQFYRNIFILDGFLSPRVAENLASYWCRDPAAPDRADLGYMEPRRIFDLGATEFASFPSASDGCLEPAQVYPTFTLQLPELAMLAAHAILSSDWDTRLDFGKDLKIFVTGAYDDPTAWDDLPNCDDPGSENVDCICSYIDETTVSGRPQPVSGIEYKALNRTFAGQESIACELIEQTKDARARYENGSGFESDFDFWRLWVERLEWARELYKVFQDR